MELLYRDMLQESAQLVGQMEQLTARQEGIAQAMQALPSTAVSYTHLTLPTSDLV